MDSGAHRRRSKVWLAFIPDGVAGDEKAICRICNNTLPRNAQDQRERGTTAKLWKHLNQEHMEVAKMLSGISQDDILKEGIMDHWNLSILQRQSSKGFTSKVWKFFGLDDTDKNISICFQCGARISRGCDRNTTSMWNHMKFKHPALYSAAYKEEDAVEEEDSSPLAVEKAAVRDQFLLHSARQNSYICKTCGTIMRLESPDEETNTSRLHKHLDNIFHKRVQHGLEPPKRPILPKYYANTLNADKKKKQEKVVEHKKLPSPVSSEKLAVDRDVDFIHTAVMMQTLYLQQKKDMCCDCTIIIPHKSERKPSNIDRIPMPGVDDGSIECYESKAGFEFKVHMSVLAVASNKLRAMFDNSRSTTIVMHDVSKESMKYFIEVAYLGKLKNLTSLSEAEVFDLYSTAQSFNSTFVIKYLERECGSIINKFSAEKVDSLSFGKFSIVFKNEDSRSTKTVNKLLSAATESLNEIGTSDTFAKDGTDHVTSKKSSSTRRKRPPLSTTFRLKVPKTVVNSDSEFGDFSNGNGTGNDVEEDSPMESGMKFEIQGDTAILRASPDGLDDSKEVGFDDRMMPPD